MEKEKENQTIQAILKGDSDAYAFLIDAYKDRIFNLAYRMTGNYEDANDLAQETFIRAFANLRRFDKQKHFFTWLYTISLNIIRNHLKKTERGRLHKTDYEKDEREISIKDENDPETDLMAKEEAGNLEMCIHRLPAEMKEAVILRFYQEISFDDIAEIMGISLSAAKMRVYRGLKKLEELLGDGSCRVNQEMSFRPQGLPWRDIFG